MPRMKVDEAQLSRKFKHVAKQTANFSKISADILAKTPSNMRIFRLVMGAGLERMAERLDKTAATISQYERGRIFSIPVSESERMCRIIEENIPAHVSYAAFLLNLRAFEEKSTGGLTKGLQRAEKASSTPQEKSTRSVLEKAGLSFEEHKTLDTKIGPLNFDFLVERKVMIECTHSKNKTKAESLGFRVLKLKERHPKMKTMVVIPRGVTNGYLRRLADFDAVIYADELDRLKVLLVPQAAVQLDTRMRSPKTPNLEIDL